MNQTIQRLLNGQTDNHIFPFLWMHGEDEATLRKMMAAIQGTGCGAVCVESRPHPDFCGPKWWQDMDIILEEARNRNMKVWVLDDSHFPTGFANGALASKPDTLCRQGIFMNRRALPAEAEEITLNLRAEGLLSAPKRAPANPMEQHLFSIPPARHFDDDRVLLAELWQNGQAVNLTSLLSGETLSFRKAPGEAELLVMTASRNAGYHRDYINMTQRDSVRVLIDAVYETHWQHYAADFGTTLAGFFSDEPELGNGFIYDFKNKLGCEQDLPWGEELESAVAEALGKDWASRLERLWQTDTDPETARVHMAYMDCLTRLVRQNFSEQIGSWCRDHGVMYIGHVIEDNGQHCRTGSSLGHYFRGLEGQDMAGIDDIGGQVLPQGEDEPRQNEIGAFRDGTFYHYGLAKLGQSAAALEPRKKRRAMCEIFGNYGWAEGVRLEKYLADHFLVRGINYFVPHAFTGKDFPDPDCPPHFYAQGHHPQYRHFGRLIDYMNRVADLTSSGKHVTPVALLYHGEAEWCDPDAMAFEVPGRELYDAQLDYHVIPADLLDEAEACGSISGKGFQVRNQTYHVMVVPGCASLCDAAARNLARLASSGVPVCFVDRKPGFVSENGEALPTALRDCPVVPLKHLAETVRKLAIPLPVIAPANDRVRLLEIQGDTPMAMVINEGTAAWAGTLAPSFPMEEAFLYDAWANRCLPVEKTEQGFRLIVEPLKSLFLVGGSCDVSLPVPAEPGEEIPLKGWVRSICEGAAYGSFSAPVPTALPDGRQLAEAEPTFSGFVRYDCAFNLPEDSRLLLKIEDASEGVEVFLNGESLGIQIAPPMVYALCGRSGVNHLRIEVATTLERECYPLLDGYRKMLAPAPTCASGLTGKVTLHTIPSAP